MRPRPTLLGRRRTASSSSLSRWYVLPFRDNLHLRTSFAQYSWHMHALHQMSQSWQSSSTVHSHSIGGSLPGTDHNIHVHTVGVLDGHRDPIAALESHRGVYMRRARTMG